MTRLNAGRSKPSPRVGQVFRLEGGRLKAGGGPVATTKPAAAQTPAEPAAPPTAEQIRQRAYQLWEAAGRPDGDGVTFWIDAERELTNPPAATPGRG